MREDNGRLESDKSASSAKNDHGACRRQVEPFFLSQHKVSVLPFLLSRAFSDLTSGRAHTSSGESSVVVTVCCDRNLVGFGSSLVSLCLCHSRHYDYPSVNELEMMFVAHNIEIRSNQR